MCSREQETGLSEVNAKKIKCLPTTICNTGIPTVINRSIIILRRFCQEGLNVEQSLDENHQYLSPSYFGSAIATDIVETAKDAKTTSRKCNGGAELNTNIYVRLVRYEG